MLLSDFIVIDNTLTFSQKDVFTTLLKVCIFQKRIPFFYFVKKRQWSDHIFEKQLLMNAVATMFEDQILYEFYDYHIGGLIQDHHVIGNPYKFWRTLDKVVKVYR